MLVALDGSGRRRVAAAEVKGGTFTCPACGAGLVVRLPQLKVPHFAHRPDQRCDAGQLQAARRVALRTAAAAARRAAAGQAGQDELFSWDELAAQDSHTPDRAQPVG